MEILLIGCLVVHIIMFVVDIIKKEYYVYSWVATSFVWLLNFMLK